MNKLLKYILITLFTFLFIYIILKNISKIFINLEGFSTINNKNPGNYLTKSENYINNEFRKLKDIESKNYRRWIHMVRRNWWLRKRHLPHHKRIFRRLKTIINRFNNRIKKHKRDKKKIEKKLKNEKKKNKCSKKDNRCKKRKKKNINKFKDKIKGKNRIIKRFDNIKRKYDRHIKNKNSFIKKIEKQIKNTNWEKKRRHKTYKNSIKSKQEYSIVKSIYDYWNKYVKKFITSNKFHKIINNEDYNGREIKKGDYILYTDNINNAINMNISLTQNNYNKIFFKIKDGNKNKSNDIGEIISQYLPNKNIYKINKIVNNTIHLTSNFDNNKKELTIIPNSTINKIYYSNGFATQNIDTKLYQFKKKNNKSLYFFLIDPKNKQNTINSTNLLYSAVIN